MLMTEREPVIYLEHAKVFSKDGCLVAYNADRTIEHIPPSSTMLLLLGAGTSITQKAGIVAAHNNMFICFARGGSYIHSIWQGGRWSPPEKMVRQALLHSDDHERLRIAKVILKLKLYKEGADQSIISKIDDLKTVRKLLSFEAHQAKKTYRDVSSEFEVFNFKRDKESFDGENSKLTLLNNALYSYATAVILQFGFHPSVGFIHGKSRRGGLSFDLADIFKYDLCIRPAFDSKGEADKDIVMNFSNNIKKKRFRVLKEMIYFLRFVNGEISESEVEDILDEHSRI